MDKAEKTKDQKSEKVNQCLKEEEKDQKPNVSGQYEIYCWIVNPDPAEKTKDQRSDEVDQLIIKTRQRQAETERIIKFMENLGFYIPDELKFTDHYWCDKGENDNKDIEIEIAISGRGWGGLRKGIQYHFLAGRFKRKDLVIEGYGAEYFENIKKLALEFGNIFGCLIFAKLVKPEGAELFEMHDGLVRYD